MRIDDRILIIEGYLKFGMEKAHICSIKGHTLCTLEKKIWRRLGRVLARRAYSSSPACSTPSTLRGPRSSRTCVCWCWCPAKSCVADGRDGWAPRWGLYSGTACAGPERAGASGRAKAPADRAPWCGRDSWCRPVAWSSTCASAT